jgi:hypothetical protein
MSTVKAVLPTLSNKQTRGWAWWYTPINNLSYLGAEVRRLRYEATLGKIARHYLKSKLKSKKDSNSRVLASQTKS